MMLGGNANSFFIAIKRQAFLTLYTIKQHEAQTTLTGRSHPIAHEKNVHFPVLSSDFTICICTDRNRIREFDQMEGILEMPSIWKTINEINQ